MYSKQNRSLRCVYTEIGRNIFYRFVGLLWNTNGSEETHPPLSSPPVSVLWLALDCFASSISRASRSMICIPLVLAQAAKVFPIILPQVDRGVLVGNNGGAGKAASARMPRLFRTNALSVSPTRWVPVAHDNGESDERAARAQPRSRGVPRCVHAFGFP